MNALVKVPKGAAGALQCMNQTLGHFAPALAISHRHSLIWDASICTIGVVGVPYTIVDARKIHRGFLAAFSEMDEACEVLQQVKDGHPPVDHATALALLNVLFAAIGKRKNDEESAILLNAAADMFNPINDILGCITGVEQINRHPLILAIAIKQLIATAKFTSCAELREAMAKVVNSIAIDVWRLEYMMEKTHNADAMLFEKDRATWDETHARVDAAIERKMLRDLENVEGAYEDDDGVPQSGSPRWQALNDLLKTKKLAAPPQPKRIAAAKKRAEIKRSTKTEKQDADESV
jgi:hypothetical protein